MAFCTDSFSITVIGEGLDADITISGEFPLSLEPGANYNIGYTYVTGQPPATAFDIEWDVTLGNGQISSARPTATFSPAAPEGSGNERRNGTVTGTLPLVRDIHYNATVWIRQP